MQVVGVYMEAQHLGNRILDGPLEAEDVGEGSQVLDGCLPDREDAVI